MSNSYIKLSTMEYPLHIGDIELDPSGMDDYAHVEWTDRPEIDIKTQLICQETPVNDNGIWRMAWSVRDLTVEELQDRELRKKEKMAEKNKNNPVL